MDSTTLRNHQIRLAARPVGLPTRADWRFTEEAVPEPEAGGVLVKTLPLSLDPAMRGWMNEGKSYIAPVGIGEVMRAGGIGRVVASRHPAFAVGRRGQPAVSVCRTTARSEPTSLSAPRLTRSTSARLDGDSGSTCSACRA